jgi:hypothetical protein
MYQYQNKILARYRVSFKRWNSIVGASGATAGCHGFIALLSKSTWRAAGARWEMKCAAEEGIQAVGVHIYKNEKGAKPPELRGRVIEWRWSSIANFIEKVDSKRSFIDKLLSW